MITIRTASYLHAGVQASMPIDNNDTVIKVVLAY